MFVNFIFSKNQLLVLLIFTIVSFTFSFISAHIFMISFLLLFFFCLFPVVLGVKLGCLFDVFLVPWGRIVLLSTSLLEWLLLHPIGFELCFHCHLFLENFFISLLISSVTCYLETYCFGCVCVLHRNILFDLHMFCVFFTVLFL